MLKILHRLTVKVTELLQMLMVKVKVMHELVECVAPLLYLSQQCQHIYSMPGPVSTGMTVSGFNSQCGIFI